MALLVPPDLDIRDEEQLAAESIGRVSGSLTVERIDSQILSLRKLRSLVESGTLNAPICPELVNANPSSPHTVLLETFGWLMAQQSRRINQLPERDQIEFHRLFGIELREPTVATTTLQFTVTAIEDTDVVIPDQTQVSTPDGQFTFETDQEIIIPWPETTASVGATRRIAGRVLLAPNVLTEMADPIAFVESVTNPQPVDSGTDAESVDEALARARNYQRRAERLVSARDLEDAILEDVLLGAGIVKAFPLIMAGDFTDLNHPRAGHTTVVVMTDTGNAVSEEVKARIVDSMQQAIGSQFLYIIDPLFVEFSIQASIKIEGITPQTAIKAGVEKALRDFYSTKRGNFGRPILRSEIIAIIEGTPGVDRIASDVNGPIVGNPAADVVLRPYELPKLNTVTLNVVP